MKATDEINWKENPVFGDVAARHLTDEFKEWWVREYGSPDDCADGRERELYWDACWWALEGWLAGRKQILESAGRE